MARDTTNVPTERYRGIADRASAVATTAVRLAGEGALRSAALRLAKAARQMAQAADERDVALGVDPQRFLRAMLEASLADLGDAA